MKNKYGFVVDFNICDNVYTDCGTSGLVVNKNKCIQYSGSWSDDKIWSLDPKNQLNLLLPEGGECPKGGKYDISMTLICDSNSSITKIMNPGEFDQTKCVNNIVIKSKYGNMESNYSLSSKRIYTMV